MRKRANVSVRQRAKHERGLSVTACRLREREG